MKSIKEDLYNEESEPATPHSPKNSRLEGASVSAIQRLKKADKHKGHKFINLVPPPPPLKVPAMKMGSKEGYQPIRSLQGQLPAKIRRSLRGRPKSCRRTPRARVVPPLGIQVTSNTRTMQKRRLLTAKRAIQSSPVRRSISPIGRDPAPLNSLAIPGSSPGSEKVLLTQRLHHSKENQNTHNSQSGTIGHAVLPELKTHVQTLSNTHKNRLPGSRYSKSEKTEQKKDLNAMIKKSPPLIPNKQSLEVPHVPLVQPRGLPQIKDPSHANRSKVGLSGTPNNSPKSSAVLKPPATVRDLPPNANTLEVSGLDLTKAKKSSGNDGQAGAISLKFPFKPTFSNLSNPLDDKLLSQSIYANLFSKNKKRKRRRAFVENQLDVVIASSRRDPPDNSVLGPKKTEFTTSNSVGNSSENGSIQPGEKTSNAKRLSRALKQTPANLSDHLALINSSGPVRNFGASKKPKIAKESENLANPAGVKNKPLVAPDAPRASGPQTNTVSNVAGKYSRFENLKRTAGVQNTQKFSKFRNYRKLPNPRKYTNFKNLQSLKNLQTLQSRPDLFPEPLSRTKKIPADNSKSRKEKSTKEGNPHSRFLDSRVEKGAEIFGKILENTIYRTKKSDPTTSEPATSSGPPISGGESRGPRMQRSTESKVRAEKKAASSSGFLVKGRKDENITSAYCEQKKLQTNSKGFGHHEGLEISPDLSQSSPYFPKTAEKAPRNPNPKKPQETAEKRNAEKSKRSQNLKLGFGDQNPDNIKFIGEIEANWPLPPRPETSPGQGLNFTRSYSASRSKTSQPFLEVQEKKNILNPSRNPPLKPLDLSGFAKNLQIPAMNSVPPPPEMPKQLHNFLMRPLVNSKSRIGIHRSSGDPKTRPAINSARGKTLFALQKKPPIGTNYQVDPSVLPKADDARSRSSSSRNFHGYGLVPKRVKRLKTAGAFFEQVIRASFFAKAVQYAKEKPKINEQRNHDPGSKRGGKVPEDGRKCGKASSCDSRKGKLSSINTVDHSNSRKHDKDEQALKECQRRLFDREKDFVKMEKGFFTKTERTRTSKMTDKTVIGELLWCTHVLDEVKVKRYLDAVKSLFEEKSFRINGAAKSYFSGFSIDRVLYLLHKCDYNIEEAISLINFKKMNPLDYYDNGGTNTTDDNYVEEDVCFLCYDGGNLLLCDFPDCKKVYHTYCLKLDRVPEGSWNCPSHHCYKCNKKSSKKYHCSYCPTAYCEDHVPNGTFGLEPVEFLCQLCSQEGTTSRQRFLMRLTETLRRKNLPLKNFRVGGNELDIYEFYCAVVRGGGAKRVTESMGWSKVRKHLKIPDSSTNASSLLKSIYIKMIYPYEKLYFANTLPFEADCKVRRGRPSAKNLEVKSVQEFETCTIMITGYQDHCLFLEADINGSIKQGFLFLPQIIGEKAFIKKHRSDERYDANGQAKPGWPKGQKPPTSQKYSSHFGECVRNLLNEVGVNGSLTNPDYDLALNARFALKKMAMSVLSLAKILQLDKEDINQLFNANESRQCQDYVTKRVRRWISSLPINILDSVVAAVENFRFKEMAKLENLKLSMKQEIYDVKETSSSPNGKRKRDGILER